MVELSVLSSSKEVAKAQIEECVFKLKQSFKQLTGKMLQNAEVKACLSAYQSFGKTPSIASKMCTILSLTFLRNEVLTGEN